jgi:hypothetical protein
MQIELVPVLRAVRDLYELPRGTERFQRYIDLMTGGGQEMLLPLSLLNPMGKEHVAATVDALLALDAETVAADAVADAQHRLSDVPGELRVALVVVDDAGGGWTDRYLTETRHRFESDGELKRGWATALLWTGEQPSARGVREETLAAIYRAAYQRRHGLPRTLNQMMVQEGSAAAFAEVAPLALSPAELDAIRAVIDPHRETTQFPVAFACLYGDEAATAVGYPPLGLSPRAGYTLALTEALQRGSPPELALMSVQRSG